MNKMKTGFCLLALCLGVALQANATQTSTDCPVAQLSVCPAPLDTQLPDVKDMLTWNQQQRVIGFRSDYRSYPGDVFKAGKAVPLPREIKDLSAVSYQYQGHDYRLADYLARNSVTGMMVIKEGKIVWDYYGGGNTKTTLWTSRSVGKSVVSTLVGAALKEGKIASLDDEIVKYNPDVRGTAWEHVTVRQLMQHTSGVVWDEDYTNPKSDFAQLTQCEANKDTYDCVNRLIKDPKRKAYAKPGQVWSYSSGGAWLLGDTLEKATGKSLAHYLQEKIWQPYGMVHDGVWHSYQVGKHDVGAHGFNATLEDWGKFGLFIMNDGVLPDGSKVLPDNWVTDARRWTQAEKSVTAAHPDGSYGYQWWNNSVPANAENVGPKHGLASQDTLWALGIFGQMIAVNPQQKLVIVQWSTWPKAEPSFSAQPLEASLMFNAIANKLAK
ncbi:CubicO group peptidase (beta-lactamase class C family) [Serratia fonticola]|jgi:CubicO group peptidase (beta-lactamase class C family)|uniref:CubicO group peptidase (Beta-lactamase class C family) n=1 Tax=Serratia fonticola TaxID=47917 RepID=A0A542BLK0_SERFO|nr:serine hydrolase [Serratia fonticola]TQI79474.1 CubicO group peptidase (beta-lactamase class C family) [Serratia fonticola]TQI98501.1 CubicO group peptidase (beta-lactamase class C family) [Serratia fonticola]TVZ68029.1 CubicO group peptidase (beta-lactamase class C family) [Serratia fonticola]